jgi:NADH-quinone oxidoreductase subunit E
VALSEAAKTEIKRLMAQFPRRQSALLGALFVAQEEAGYLRPDVVADVAQVLDLAESEVVSVASFYHLFHFEPVGRDVIQVCTNISCLLNGCHRVLARLRERLGIEVGQTTPDGAYTLQTAECLGACEEAPVVMVGTERYGPVTADGIDALLGRHEGKGGGNPEPLPGLHDTGTLQAQDPLPPHQGDQ